MILKLIVAADLFHCTLNRCRPLSFVNIFSITEKIDLVASEPEDLIRPGNKQISGFATQIK